MGFRVKGIGFKFQGSGFRVKGVQFRSYGLGFRVQELGLPGDQGDFDRSIVPFTPLAPLGLFFFGARGFDPPRCRMQMQGRKSESLGSKFGTHSLRVEIFWAKG